jgi:protease secretion system membrane fusion protein
MPFYKIQVAVTEKGMEKLQNNVIRAGMPADVFIVTGERTMMNYLLRPILDRAYTSMREE